MAEDPKYIELSYYCKSKNFLYPILGFKRNESFRPQTYLFFQHHSILNGELVVLYPNEGDILYKNFEQNKVAPHPLLKACYQIPHGTVYIFDIAGHHSDIEHFLAGEYSKFSKSLKRTILKYMDDSIENTTPAPDRATHAVLFPESYRPLVAIQLGVPAKNLTELASIYDLQKESLEVEDFSPCEIIMENNTLI